MLRVEQSKNAVQWTDAGKHYVGKPLTDHVGDSLYYSHNDDYVLVQIDYDGGLVFVKAAKLRRYPDAPIPEPTLPAVEGQQVS